MTGAPLWLRHSVAAALDPTRRGPEYPALRIRKTGALGRNPAGCGTPAPSAARARETGISHAPVPTFRATARTDRAAGRYRAALGPPRLLLVLRPSGALARGRAVPRGIPGGCAGHDHSALHRPGDHAALQPQSGDAAAGCRAAAPRHGARPAGAATPG